MGTDPPRPAEKNYRQDGKKSKREENHDKYHIGVCNYREKWPIFPYLS